MQRRGRESMGRQNKDGAVVGSSIMLLQERFKQLQRLKEMREEKQITKLMPQATDHHDLSAMSFSTSGAAYQDPLALGLNSASRDHTPYLRSINPQQFSVRGPHKFLEIPDVDTSLRL